MKIKKFRYLAIAAMTCLLLPISSQAELKKSPQYEKCMDNVDYGAFKNSQWTTCTIEELKKLDVVLNFEYNRVRKNLTAEQRDSMTKGQRSWLKFREDWCRFEEVGPMAPGGEASYNFCLLEMTGKHIENLKEIAQ